MLAVENFEHIFYILAIVSSVIFLIKIVVFTFTGCDFEVFADFDSITDMDGSFHFLSVQSVLAFLMGFGWMGLACLKQFALGIHLSILFAFLFGLFCLFFISYLFYLIKKLEKKVVIDFSTLIGSTGKSYTSFPAKGSGQIEVVFNEKLTILPAINNTDLEINAFEQIKVVEFKENVLYIEKI